MYFKANVDDGGRRTTLETYPLITKDPGIFVRGGGGGVQVSLTKKVLTFFLFCFFLVLSLFYRSQMVNFKEIVHFSRFQRESNIFQGGGGVQLFPGGGGPTFSRGGSNCLFPIETHVTCDFPGGGVVRTPCPPPLDPHLKLTLNQRLWWA